MLEHKFYFDELYDRVFYAPSVALAQTLYRVVERPSRPRLRRRYRLGRAQSRPARRRTPRAACIRLYALLIAAGLVVILVVFLAVQ